MKISVIDTGVCSICHMNLNTARTVMEEGCL